MLTQMNVKIAKDMKVAYLGVNMNPEIKTIDGKKIHNIVLDEYMLIRVDNKEYEFRRNVVHDFFIRDDGKYYYMENKITKEDIALLRRAYASEGYEFTQFVGSTSLLCFVPDKVSKEDNYLDITKSIVKRFTLRR